MTYCGESEGHLLRRIWETSLNSKGTSRDLLRFGVASGKFWKMKQFLKKTKNYWIMYNFYEWRICEWRIHFSRKTFHIFWRGSSRYLGRQDPRPLYLHQWAPQLGKLGLGEKPFTMVANTSYKDVKSFRTCSRQLCKRVSHVQQLPSSGGRRWIHLPFSAAHLNVAPAQAPTAQWNEPLGKIAHNLPRKNCKCWRLFRRNLNF